MPQKLKYAATIRGIFREEGNTGGTSLEDSLNTILRTILGRGDDFNIGFAHLVSTYRSGLEADFSVTRLPVGHSVQDKVWEMEIEYGEGKGQTISNRYLQSVIGKQAMFPKGVQKHFSIPLRDDDQINEEKHAELDEVIAELHGTAIAYAMRDGIMYGVDVDTETRGERLYANVKIVANPDPEDQVGGLKKGDNKFTMYVIPFFKQETPVLHGEMNLEGMKKIRREGDETYEAAAGTITLINVPTKYKISAVAPDLSTHASQVVSSLLSKGGKDAITGLLDAANLNTRYTELEDRLDRSKIRMEKGIERTGMKRILSELGAKHRETGLIERFSMAERVLLGIPREVVSFYVVADDQGKKYIASQEARGRKKSHVAGSLMEILGESVDGTIKRLNVGLYGKKITPRVVVGHEAPLILFGYTSDLTIEQTIKWAQMQQRDFLDRELLGEERASAYGDVSSSVFIGKVGMMDPKELRIALKRKLKEVLKEQRVYRAKEREAKKREEKLDPSKTFSRIHVLSGSQFINGVEYLSALEVSRKRLKKGQ